MEKFLIAIHIFICVLLVLVVLVQSGKGADISASFGGSSQTIFGSSGGANFFTRMTAVLAALFMATSIILTIMSSNSRKSLFEGTPEAAATQTPGAQPSEADKAASPEGAPSEKK